MKAEAKAQNAGQKVQTAALAIRQVAELSAEPRTREELIAGAGVGKTAGRPAIALLLNEGVLAEVQVKQRHSPAWKVWTAAKAAAAGIPLLGAEVAP